MSFFRCLYHFPHLSSLLYRTVKYLSPVKKVKSIIKPKLKPFLNLKLCTKPAIVYVVFPQQLAVLINFTQYRRGIAYRAIDCMH